MVKKVIKWYKNLIAQLHFVVVVNYIFENIFNFHSLSLLYRGVYSLVSST